MSNRLIEKCFDIEEFYRNLSDLTYWIVDPYIVENLPDMSRLKPGKIIKVKNLNPVEQIYPTFEE